MGLVLDWETKIPHALWQKKKKKRQIFLISFVVSFITVGYLEVGYLKCLEFS